MPGLAQAGIGRGVLLFSLGASLVPALLFERRRVRGPDARGAERPAVRERRGTMSARARRRAASALVAAEIALAVVLLIGAGLTLRSFADCIAVDPGFTAAGVLTLELALPAGRYEADEPARAVLPARVP